MRVVYLVPPGRFPTVIVDPGQWWDTVAASGRHEVLGYSANFHWWRGICHAGIKEKLLTSFGPAQRLRKRLEWSVANLDLRASARAGANALEVLRTASGCSSARLFLDATRDLAGHLGTLNRAQSELQFSLSPGLRVRDVNYHDSGAMLQCARTHPVLARLVAQALACAPTGIDFLAVSVTSAESLLTAMVAVRLLRESNPRMHCCLADHGYENFSLHAHIDALRASHNLDQLFDTIVEAKDDRDTLLPTLIDSVAAGRPMRGFVKSMPAASQPDLLTATTTPTVLSYSPPPVLPTFTPEPVLFTRLSRRRCYWSRCTFCTQNTKYDDPRAASRLEVPKSLDRLSAYVNAGYRNIVFSDEAIAPATLRILSQEILKRGIKFQWTCRCRLELAHNRELFELMRAAGCYEILFGLESISTRVQMLMDKHVEGMDEARVRAIFDDMVAAGLGIHVTMIVGFPGDTPEDSERTVNFVIDTLRGARNATFYLNRFCVFPDTIILREPARFGVARVVARGDMPSTYDYEMDPTHDASMSAIARYPQLHTMLVQGLGWACLGGGDAGAAAELLYFTSGWGAMFKALPANPFANPLVEAPDTALLV